MKITDFIDKTAGGQTPDTHLVSAPPLVCLPLPAAIPAHAKFIPTMPHIIPLRAKLIPAMPHVIPLRAKVTPTLAKVTPTLPNASKRKAAS